MNAKMYSQQLNQVFYQCSQNWKKYPKLVQLYDSVVQLGNDYKSNITPENLTIRGRLMTIYSEWFKSHFDTSYTQPRQDWDHFEQIEASLMSDADNDTDQAIAAFRQLLYCIENDDRMVKYYFTPKSIANNYNRIKIDIKNGIEKNRSIQEMDHILG